MDKRIFEFVCALISSGEHTHNTLQELIKIAVKSVEEFDEYFLSENKK